ncbi:MAG: hypothetical protein JHC95_08440 [Solirubrobacteraceae bacterium]|nr:hypothetical protein [Solirubrobacteraceae bacterium]
MSAFAGGCAICGADLDAHRARLAQRPSVAAPARTVPNVRMPHLAAWINPDYALISLTVLLLVISPGIGMLLAGLGAWDRNGKGRVTMRNVFLGLLGFGVLLFLVPAWRYGLLSLVY